MATLKLDTQVSLNTVCLGTFHDGDRLTITYFSEQQPSCSIRVAKLNRYNCGVNISLTLRLIYIMLTNLFSNDNKGFAAVKLS